jgi:hypothetical protein
LIGIKDFDMFGVILIIGLQVFLVTMKNVNMERAKRPLIFLLVIPT